MSLAATMGAEVSLRGNYVPRRVPKYDYEQKPTTVLVPEIVPDGPAPELPKELFTIPIDVVERILGADNRVNDMEVRHYFSNGLYARELYMPAGTIATARRHKHQHLSVISSGQITVWGPHQVEPVVVNGPATIPGLPGVRRVGYVHSDVVWTTIWPHDGTTYDIDDLFDYYMEEVPPEMSEAQIQDWIDSHASTVRLLTGGK